MNSIFVVVLVCFFTGRVLAANIDDVCTKDADCSGTVTYSECYKKYSNCAKGECRCKSGYQANSGKTTCLKEKGYDDACDATTYCLYGLECNSGTSKCACTSGNSYNSKLKLCVTTGLMAVGEACTTVANCYGSSTMLECSSSKCACKAGYLQEGYTCRQPYVSKACTSGVGCTKQTDIGAGQETETCVSDKCKCPDTADTISLTEDGVSYKLCLTKYTSKKATDATCTQGNQCSSNRCGTCPGESSSICLKLNGAEKVGSISLLFYVAVVVMAFVF